MIQSVAVTNHAGESLLMELSKPWQTGFLITSIDGLGEVNANINFTDLVTADGSIDNFARLGNRNIVLNLTFMSDKLSIEECRMKSYKYFPVKKNVTFYVKTDSRFVKTEGRVEANDPDIFSDKEGCQISILCPDPYFYDANGDQETLFYGVNPLFEFPFSNESLTEKLIEFGEIRLKHEDVIIYDGEGDTGFEIYIHATGDVTELRIFNTKTREMTGIDDDRFKAICGSGIKKGDTIIVSSIVGRKGAVLFRDGLEFNILNALIRPLVWFILEKGANKFAFTTKKGATKLEFKIRNRILFNGV